MLPLIVKEGAKKVVGSNVIKKVKGMSKEQTQGIINNYVNAPKVEEKEENGLLDTIKETVGIQKEEEKETNPTFKAEEEEQQTEEEQTKPSLLKNGLQTAEELPKQIKSNLPKFGGIGILLFVILFLLFTIKPVKDETGEEMKDEKGGNVTRLKLIWRVLIGRAEMREQPIDEEEADVYDTVRAYNEPNAYGIIYPAANDFDASVQLGNDIGEKVTDFSNWLKDRIGG